MRGYDACEVVTVTKAIMKQFHGKKDQAKRQDGQGRLKMSESGDARKAAKSDLVALMLRRAPGGNVVDHTPSTIMLHHRQRPFHEANKL